MNIAIIGYGKMGKTIERLALERNHLIPLKISSQNKADLTIENLQKADVAIEFSRPESAFDNIKMCLESDIPVISGTTGWMERKKEIENLCMEREGAFLYASNFSIGVNIFFHINKVLAELMNNQEDYNVSIKEIHHTAKLDAPSGTGITLANDIIKKLQRKSSWVNKTSERSDEISLVSQRKDPAPGTHSIRYSSAIDDIEIIHTAHSREGFALGSILAAEWIKGRRGIYSMEDVLSIGK